MKRITKLFLVNLDNLKLEVSKEEIFKKSKFVVKAILGEEIIRIDKFKFTKDVIEKILSYSNNVNYYCFLYELFKILKYTAEKYNICTSIFERKKIKNFLNKLINYLGEIGIIVLLEYGVMDMIEEIVIEGFSLKIGG